ncbi:Metal resistance protein YCF1 [Smittium mucronatum]|uniref:Metal resistance protein YCF1 n=1 Tax=Smittium mucronatum TaxID=133383 RepID=A0A1R0H0X1_9FUNG|nr:Metal resistance protein YCF1 [Smittium mucronatum]
MIILQKNDASFFTSSKLSQLYWFFNILSFLVVLNTKCRLLFYSLFNFEIYTLISNILAQVCLLLSLSLQNYDSPNPFLPAQEFSPNSINFKTPPPEENSNIFSITTYSWIYPLIKLRSKRKISNDDMYTLPKVSDTPIVSENFWSMWLEERKSNRNSLLMVIIKNFSGSMLIAAFCKFINDISQFMLPILLKYLLDFVSTYSSDTPLDPLIGIYYAFAMLLFSLIRSVALNQHFNHNNFTAMGVRAGLISNIYKKSMLLSNKSRAKYNSGDIINRMSVDSQRIYEFIQYSQNIWSSPFQVILALYLSFVTLGWSAIVGLIIMILFIPLNAMFTGWVQKVQEEQMQNKDSRVRLTQESLQGIKIIKLYAWETPFLERIRSVRNNLELVSLKQFGVISVYQSIIYVFIPFLVTLLSFATYAIFDGKSRGPLNSNLIFVSVASFNLLQFPLIIMPYTLNMLIEAKIGLERIREYLMSEELENNTITRLDIDGNGIGLDGNPINAEQLELNEDVLVSVKNANFWWDYNPAESKPTLSNVSFSVKNGELLSVVGKVGSGKSSLLHSLLGEMSKSAGSVTIRGKIAYVPQQPWIMNCSARDNILFGLDYDPEFYSKVVFACCLEHDFSLLPNGDKSEIGEKGTNLSGGQKARLGLARAVYSRSDVYLLDDPLSAVDVHVGHHLFKHVLGPEGLLKSKARILCTNAISYLRHSDSVLLLQDGVVLDQGDFPTLLLNNTIFSKLIEDYGSIASHIDSQTDSETDQPVSENASYDGSSVDDALESTKNNTEVNSESNFFETCDDFKDTDSVHPLSFQRKNSVLQVDLDQESVFSNDGVLIEEETSKTGSVDRKIYLEYMKYCGIFYFLFFIVAFIISEALVVLSVVWLKYWGLSNESGQNYLFYYLGIFSLIGFFYSLLVGLRQYVLMSVCAVRASKITHENMLVSIFKSPMSFFDTTPHGRIINRFSKDQSTLDEEVPYSLSEWLTELLNIASNVVAIVFTLPAFFVFAVPAAILFLKLQDIYLNVSRELKRLDSVSKSPIYQNFQETLDGISTIRSFGQKERFEGINGTRLDTNQKVIYSFFALNRWVSVRLDFMSSFMIFFIALVSVLLLSYYDDMKLINSGTIGSALTFAFAITNSLSWCIRMYCKIETDIVSLERINEYSNLVSEKFEPEAGEATDPKMLLHWPGKGSLEFKSYSTVYREGLKPVLKNLSFDIKASEKGGVFRQYDYNDCAPHQHDFGFGSDPGAGRWRGSRV